MRFTGILCRHHRSHSSIKIRCLNNSNSTKVCHNSIKCKDNPRWCSLKITSMCWYKPRRAWFRCPSSLNNNFHNSSSKWLKLDICNPSSSIPCIHLNSSSCQIRWAFIHRRYSSHAEDLQRCPRSSRIWAIRLVAKRPRMSWDTNQCRTWKRRAVLSSHHSPPRSAQVKTISPAPSNQHRAKSSWKAVVSSLHPDRQVFGDQRYPHAKKSKTNHPTWKTR